MTFVFKNLANNKTPGHDKKPKAILKNMLENFHKLFFVYFSLIATSENKSQHHDK